MGKGVYSSKSFSRKVCATTMSVAMAVAFTPTAAFAATGAIDDDDETAIVSASSQESIFLDGLYLENDWFEFTGQVIDVSKDVTVEDSEYEDVDPKNYTLSYEKADSYDDYTAISANQVLGVGEYRVTATAKAGSGYKGSVFGTFEIAGTDISDACRIHLSNDYFEYEAGKAVQLEVSVLTRDGSAFDPANYTLSYSKYDEGTGSYKTVAADKLIEPGRYRVTVTGVSERGYTGSTYETFQIYSQYDLSNGYLSPNRSNYIATGSPITPSFVLRDHNWEVVSSDNYTLSYEKVTGHDEDGDDTYSPISASQLVEIGTYRATAKAKASSKYTGSRSAEFRIVSGKDLNYGTLSIENCIYTGKAVSPKVTLKDPSGKEVDAGKYELSYRLYDKSGDEYAAVAPNKLVDVGTYYVTATAKAGSGYTGEAHGSFAIISRTDFGHATINAIDGYIDGTEVQKPEVSIVDIAGDTVDSSKYVLEYQKGDSSYSNFTDVDTSQIVKPGYYRVKATAKSGSGYTGDTGYEYFRVIDCSDLSNGSLSLDDYVYVKTGKAITPGVLLHRSSKERREVENLVDFSDYTLSYEKYDEGTESYTPVAASGVVDVGKYRVTATPKSGSSYSGKASAEFYIVEGTDISHGDVMLADSKGMAAHEYGYGYRFVYTGSAITPSLLVRSANDVELPSSAYSVSYQKFDEDTYRYVDIAADKVVEPGLYMVVATAKDGSGYTGSARGQFRIYKSNDLSGATLKDNAKKSVSGYTGDEYGYTGKAISLGFSVTGVDGKAVDTRNYTLTYEKRVGGSGDYTKVSAGEVSDIGQYRVVVTAKEGSGYTGECSKYFNIVDRTNLCTGTYDLSFGKSGAEIKVYDCDGNLVPSKNYTVAYWKYDSDKGTYVSVSGVSSKDSGRYRIIVKAKAGSGYRDGQIIRFSIMASADTDKPANPTNPTNPTNPSTPSDPSNPAQVVTSATVNVATVTAKSVKSALGTNAATVNTVTLGKNVKKISAKAFAGTNVKTLVLKTKKLTKKSVKNALKGSKVKTVKVQVGNASANKKQVKAYKKIFTKKICGKKVAVK